MHAVPQQELIEEFTTNARRAAATVERIEPTAAAVNTALVRAVEGADVVLCAPPETVAPALLAGFFLNHHVVMHPDGTQLKTVRVGVTDAAYGVASTGSVCVSVTKGLASAISMLTRVHIVLVEARRIVSRPSDLFTRESDRGSCPSGSFTFITGPSATADMGPLVRGVHGPGRLHIIVLG
jgi:L-lactate dehydrogenase complex protein LldG